MDFKLNLQSESVWQAHPVKPRAVEPETSIREVFRFMQEHKIGSVLICREEKLLGVFTERDALKLMTEEADLDRPIEDVMARTPTTLTESDNVGTAIRKMSLGGHRRLPIVDDQGRAVGLVKVSGILHYLVEHFPQTIYNLPPKPHPTTQEREGA